MDDILIRLAIWSMERSYFCNVFSEISIDISRGLLDKYIFVIPGRSFISSRIFCAILSRLSSSTCPCTATVMTSGEPSKLRTIGFSDPSGKDVIASIWVLISSLISLISSPNMISTLMEPMPSSDVLVILFTPSTPAICSSIRMQIDSSISSGDAPG